MLPRFRYDTRVAARRKQSRSRARRHNLPVRRRSAAHVTPTRRCQKRTMVRPRTDPNITARHNKPIPLAACAEGLATSVCAVLVRLLPGHVWWRRAALPLHSRAATAEDGAAHDCAGVL